ncbi:hypothetical protein [Janthinobacterium sp. LB3P112]|uniref:hypothetical protein n=1 Tax=Janthinobacterium sp. LB3P112 TaxID=3424196 RepID=UPI003F1ED98B
MPPPPAQLIGYLSRVDRPHHDAVLALVKRAILLPKLIRPLAATILAYLLLAYVAGLGTKALPVAAVVGAVMLLVTFLDNNVMRWAERNSSRIAMVLAVLALFFGLAATLLTKKEPLVVLAAGAGGFCVTWIVVTIGLVFLTLLIHLASLLLRAFASPIAAPVLAIFAHIHNRLLRTKYKGWVTSQGTPIIEFGSEGVKNFAPGNEAIFVSSPRFRCGGAAMAAGIPLFTAYELGNDAIIDQRVRAAYDALRATSSESHDDIANHPLMDFNPANGLPMIAGLGSVDVMGNAFGTDSHQSYHDVDMGHDSFNNH